MKLIRTRAKYPRKGYKTNEHILLALDINPVVTKIENYRNKLLQRVRRMDRDRLPHLIMEYQLCGKRIQQQLSTEF